MALLPASFIDGGRVPASMLRMFAWVATNGATGVVTYNDLKVQALVTPGGAVSINAGGAVIATRFGNSTKQQSYIVANDQAFNLTIPAAGAAGRTDYVILRISDPQYSGQIPPDPQNALYCEVVTVASLPTTYPYIALAKIVLPANTATITNSMITDLRVMANPRNRLEMDATFPTVKDEIATTDDFVGSVTFDVPAWATYMRVKGDFAGIGVQVAAQGTAWIRADSRNSQQTVVKGDSPGTNFTSRLSTVAVWRGTVPAQYRGNTITINFYMKKTGGSGKFLIDSGSTLAAVVEFEEKTL